MTTPPADSGNPPAAPPAGDEAGRIASIDQKIAAVKDEILGEVRKLVGSARDRETGHLTDPDQSKQARAGQTGQSLEQMIADAIKVNEDAKAKEAADKKAAEDLAAVKAAVAEKPPVQRGRAHRFMGWGEPSK